MKTRVSICPVFQLVFFTVLFLTILSGGTTLWLASKNHLTEYQTRVLENSTATWLTGTGAIFGLLGSKVTQLLEGVNNLPNDGDESKGN